MPTSTLGRRRARPVADAPALDGGEVAKAWLVELVALAPLERAARLPGPRFAEDAPRLCAAVAAALASDAALADLEPGGSLAPLAAGAGHLAAAPAPLDAVAALDALRAVVWAAALAALDRPVPAQVGELADRLASVVATISAATLEPPHPLGPTRPGDRGPLAAVLRRTGEEPGAAPAPDAAAPEGVAPPAPESFAPPVAPAPAPPAREVAVGEGFAPDASAPARERFAPPAPLDPNAGPVPRVYVEDLGGDVPPLEAEPAAPAEPPRTADVLARIESALRDAATAADPLGEAAARLRSLTWDDDEEDDTLGDPFESAADRLRAEAPAPPLDEPRIRRITPVEDASAHATRPSPWRAAIARRLERHAKDGLPFAVLCLEIADADRLVAADADGETARALDQAEGAIVAQLRPADALVREAPGRYWLTAPDTDGDEGRALAHRIASAVADVEPHRGAPLYLAAGVTACPADADGAEELEGLAEEALFAARAAGLRVSSPPRAS